MIPSFWLTQDHKTTAWVLHDTTVANIVTFGKCANCSHQTWTAVYGLSKSRTETNGNLNRNSNKKKRESRSKGA